MKLNPNHSALATLSVASAYFPEGFKALDKLRGLWRDNLYYHPACHLPIAAALAILTQGVDHRRKSC